MTQQTPWLKSPKLERSCRSGGQHYGGGSFLACKDLGTIRSLPVLFFFDVEINLCTPIPLFIPGSIRSSSASWDNCSWMFPDKLHVSSSLDRFPHYVYTVNPSRLRWVEGVCVFMCNLPPALLAEWPGSFTCHWGNTRVEWIPDKSQHTKLTLEKKILLPPCTCMDTHVWWCTSVGKQFHKLPSLPKLGNFRVLAEE